MEIMIPVWQEEAGVETATSDLRELRGVTLALVDDGYDPPFTEEVELRLREDYGAVVTRFPKPHGSAPSPTELIAQAAQSQVAVVGIAL